MTEDERKKKAAVLNKFAVRARNVTAVMLTPDNLDYVAEFCNGSVKGIALPAEQRVIEFWSKDQDAEVRVDMGHWVVNDAGYFEVLTDARFQQRFALVA